MPEMLQKSFTQSCSLEKITPGMNAQGPTGRKMSRVFFLLNSRVFELENKARSFLNLELH